MGWVAEADAAAPGVVVAMVLTEVWEACVARTAHLTVLGSRTKMVLPTKAWVLAEVCAACVALTVLVSRTKTALPTRAWVLAVRTGAKKWGGCGKK